MTQQPIQFHDYTPTDVVVPDDPVATSKAARRLSRDKRQTGQLLRLTVVPDDLDKNGRIRYGRELMFYSCVVVLKTPAGYTLKKYAVHRDDALVGLPEIVA